LGPVDHPCATADFQRKTGADDPVPVTFHIAGQTDSRYSISRSFRSRVAASDQTDCYAGPNADLGRDMPVSHLHADIRASATVPGQALRRIGGEAKDRVMAIATTSSSCRIEQRASGQRSLETSYPASHPYDGRRKVAPSSLSRAQAEFSLSTAVPTSLSLFEHRRYQRPRSTRLQSVTPSSSTAAFSLARRLKTPACT